MYDLGFDSCDDLGQEQRHPAGFVGWNHRGLLDDFSRFPGELFAGPACYSLFVDLQVNTQMRLFCRKYLTSIYP